MKALTICNPYPRFILDGTKDAEYRSWPTRHRAILAIHAGKSKKWMERCHHEWPFYGTLVWGAFVGVCEIADCVPSDDGDGGYHWLLANVRELPEPIPIAGQRGLWDVPLSIEGQIRTQLERRAS